MLGHTPAWLAQVGALADGTSHPSRATLTVTYVAVVREGTPAPAGARWVPLDALRELRGPRGVSPRQRTAVTAAVRTLRDRMALDGIAFHLLPERFTLAALQATHELLLERPLHKASFRRTLAAADLVEATDEWQSEGRGRPAQLFRWVAGAQRTGANRATVSSARRSGPRSRSTGRSRRSG